MSDRAILFCPVRERAAIFAEVLASHRALEGRIERWYFDDNDDSETRAMLAREPGVKLLTLLGLGEKTEYLRPEVMHQWNRGLMSRVAAIKNAAIAEFLRSRGDYLFLCDADLVLNPKLIRHLTSFGPIVSAVFWSQWRLEEPYLPNVWDRHNYAFDGPESVLRFVDQPRMYQVGGLGACTMIRRDALAAGVNFAPVTGLEHPGEDRHFSTRASALGFPLYASPHFPPFHIYRESQLDEARAWRERGCPPDYFREVWLTDQWREQVKRFVGGKAVRSIAVCLPGETFSSTWLCNWSELLPHFMQLGFNVSCHFHHASSPYIVRASAMESVMGLPEKPDYVLWIDDDQILSPAKFDLLLSDLEQLPEADMVAGWSWCQDYDEPGARVSAGRYSEADQTVTPIPGSEMERLQGLIEVEWTGFPAVLMRYSALEKVGRQPFAPIPAPNSRWGWTGEDISFCVNLKARSQGRMFVDSRCFVPHLKLRAIGPMHAKAEEKGVLVDVSR